MSMTTISGPDVDPEPAPAPAEPPIRWLVVERQKGEGCDYSIGCGLRVLEVFTRGYTTPDVAYLAHLQEAMGENVTSAEAKRAYFDVENQIVNVRFYRVEEWYELSLDKWRADVANAAEAVAKEATEIAERARLAELKAKYER